jgi:hypothetical protein
LLPKRRQIVDNGVDQVDLGGVIYCRGRCYKIQPINRSIYRRSMYWGSMYLRVDILGVNVLEVDILGVDVLGVNVSSVDLLR